MKALALGCLLLLLGSMTRAQGQTVACPMFYPSADAPIAEVPYEHKGKGVVKRRQLSDVGVFYGEFNGATELQGLRKDVKGGYDVEMPLVTKWLVCSYGGGVEWWEEAKPADQVKSCILQVRKAKGNSLDAKLICK
jgi:hypothetical protein